MPESFVERFYFLLCMLVSLLCVQKWELWGSARRPRHFGEQRTWKAWLIPMPESVRGSKVGITLECPLGTVSNNKTRLNGPHRTALAIYR